MKVLLTGASGLLGHDIWKVFSESHELIAIGRTQPQHVPAARWRACDVRDAASVYGVVTKENPDLLVNCASYNDVDGAETHQDEAFRVNATGVRNLALACQRFDTVLMTVSTDYVFSGSGAPKDGYREFDAANPVSIYGESKRWGEIFTEQLLSKYFIVRTSSLFGGARSTYADKAVEWARAGQPVPCVKDMQNSPTYTPDLAKAMYQLAASQLYGIYHLTNSGSCSRVEFAREILAIHKLPEKSLNPVSQTEFKHAAKRPAFSALQNLAWHLNGFTPLRPWKDALREHFSSKVTR